MVKFTDKLEEKRSKEPKAVEPAFSMIINGNVKVGKTTLACTAQECGLTVLLNFENRVAHIPETENLKIWPNNHTICTSVDINNLVKFIEANEDHGIKFVIIDTIDSLFYNYEKITMDKNKTCKLEFDDRKSIYIKILRLTELLKNEFRINSIINAHPKKDDTTGKIAMQLSPGLKNPLNKSVDFIFYLEFNEQKKRVLHTNNNYLYECGQSTEIGKEIPDTVEDPTIMKILNYMKGAKDGSVEQGIQAEDKKVN